MTNPAGISPIEYKVLIAPNDVENKIGNIFIPETTQDREKYAQVIGTIVAVSPFAFTDFNDCEWVMSGLEKPGPGSRVLYAKYAGVRVKGNDGKDYLLVNDKDIGAVIEG